MALIAHQAQGSCSTFALRPKPWFKGVKLKPSITLQFVGRKEALFPAKHSFHIRGKPFILPKGKAFKVSYFKGNVQNDESEDSQNGSRFSKTPLQLSRTQEDREENIPGSQLQNHPLSYPSEGTGTGSLEIQKLFRKWLIMLRMQTSSQRVDEAFSEGPALITTSEHQHVTMRTKAGEILKAAMMYFLGLDAMISLPLLIFIPWYLTIKVVYGAEVTKELTPLWVLGPLIVALYIKIIRGLCSLYVFCFLQTVQLVKNLPAYSLLIYSFIAEGKLKAFLGALLWKPVVEFINMDYKESFRRRYNWLAEWAYEKYLDYIESVWPYYCRMIRFLKKANLI